MKSRSENLRDGHAHGADVVRLHEPRDDRIEQLVDLGVAVPARIDAARRRRAAARGTGSRRYGVGGLHLDETIVEARGPADVGEALVDLPAGARLDDVLDALAVAWSAARSLRVAETMPSGIANTVESAMAAASFRSSRG